MASDKEELMQRFDVLVHTRTGTCPLNVEYGIDYDWINRQGDIYTPDQAFLLDLIKRIDRKVEPLIVSFDVTRIIPLGDTMIIDLELRSANDLNTSVRMTLP